MRLLLVLPLALLACAPTAAPATQPTAEAVRTTVVIPTVGPVPTVSPDVASQMAERYVRALYANDPTTLKELYPFFQVNERPQEADWTLQSLTVSPISPSEAGDKDPATRYTWARVVVTRPQGERSYLIGVVPGRDGRPVVNAILG